MNHPMPSSPLPWRCDKSEGCSQAEVASILDSQGGTVASDYEFYPEAVQPEDQAFIVWAANNAPKLADRVKELEARLLPAGNGTDYIDHYKARVAELEAELERVRSALNGYRDSNLSSLAESVSARSSALEAALRQILTSVAGGVIAVEYEGFSATEIEDAHRYLSEGRALLEPEGEST